MATQQDKKPTFGTPFAHTRIMPGGLTAELLDAMSFLNYSGHNILKHFGSCVFLAVGDPAITGYTVVMATGDESVSQWQPLTGTNLPLTPAGYTGDVSRAGSDGKPVIKAVEIGGNNIPVIAQVDVINTLFYGNDKRYSGKKLGAAIIVALTAGGFELAIASGNAITDTWVGIGGNVYTPVGGSVPVDGVKPRAIDIGNSITAVDFPVATRNALEDIGASINAGDGIFNGKRQGAFMVIAETAELRMTDAGLPESVWYKLNSNNADDPITPA